MTHFKDDQERKKMSPERIIPGRKVWIHKKPGINKRWIRNQELITEISRREKENQPINPKK